KRRVQPGGTSGTPLTTATSCFALLPRPAFLHALPRTPKRQRIRRHIFRDAACGCDVSAPSNLYRRHQRRVAADERAILDHRLVFLLAVVIAGDGARPDVHAFPDFRVAQIAEVIGLRTLAQLGFLRLDEVPQVSPFAHLASRPHMSVRTEDSPRPHPRVFHDRSRLHRYTIAKDRIPDDAVRAEAAIRAHLRLTQQL